MDWLIDNIKAFIESVKERIKNPFTERNAAPFSGAFLIAFSLYNWRLMFTLLSFDDSETRVTKIRIIECFLAQEAWYSRIGWPIILAFISITFFYVFSITSLGLTTFFNRWFKAIILQLFDRGKIIAREEFEKLNARTNNSKRANEKLKDAMVKIEDEKALIDKQLTDLNRKYTEVVEENEKLKKEGLKMSTNDTQNRFLILFAQYGGEEQYRDVTDTVKTLLARNSSFVVNNRILETDPIPYTIKRLTIVYEYQGDKTTFVANEEEVVKLENGSLTSSETEKSKLKQSYLTNIPRLSSILSGSWELTFISREGVKSVEPIVVDSSGKYFAHSKLRFYLRTVAIDEQTKKISFNKIDLERKLHSKENLTIQDDNLITGTDSKGYRVEYRRKQD